MENQKELARSFSELHVKGSPVMIFNVWDAGTAGKEWMGPTRIMFDAAV